jgi:hypothetical protein
MCVYAKSQLFMILDRMKTLALPYPYPSWQRKRLSYNSFIIIIIIPPCT